jgi:hypothetical protein
MNIKKSFNYFGPVVKTGLFQNINPQNFKFWDICPKQRYVIMATTKTNKDILANLLVFELVGEREIIFRASLDYGEVNRIRELKLLEIEEKQTRISEIEARKKRQEKIWEMQLKQKILVDWKNKHWPMLPRCVKRTHRRLRRKYGRKYRYQRRDARERKMAVLKEKRKELKKEENKFVREEMVKRGVRKMKPVREKWLVKGGNREFQTMYSFAKRLDGRGDENFVCNMGVYGYVKNELLFWVLSKPNRGVKEKRLLTFAFDGKLIREVGDVRRREVMIGELKSLQRLVDKNGVTQKVIGVDSKCNFIEFAYN